MHFPLIIKHPRGYGSIGMDPAAKVVTPHALATRVGTALASWGAALVEEFVGGREATVLVVEGDTLQTTALVPIECVFPGSNPGAFKDFATKFGAGALQWQAMDNPKDTSLAAALRDAAVKVFRALKCTGYARADFRIDAHGQPVFLELNPNCGVFYPSGPDVASADAVLHADPLGHIGAPSFMKCQETHCCTTWVLAGFTKAIIAAALARHTQRAPVQAWHDARYRRPGLRTTGAVAAGGTVLEIRQQPRWCTDKVCVALW